MSNMADAAMARMRQDGIDTSLPPDQALGGGNPAQGTEEGQSPTTPSSAAAPSTPDSDGRSGGPPDTIPYSRFAEVNGRLSELKEYEVLKTYGIEPDSAVRLANFEQAYVSDPVGVIGSMVDQLDLPESRKEAVKDLLLAQARGSDGAQQMPVGNDTTPDATPEWARETVDYVRQQRAADQDRDSQARLDLVVGHWRSLDTADGIANVPERQRLQYIQTAAAGGGFSTLEELAEVARNAWLEDRDALLGGAITPQRRASGSPSAVPSGGIPPMTPVVPKTMAEARKLIEADIAAGRLPDLQPGG